MKGITLRIFTPRKRVPTGWAVGAFISMLALAPHADADDNLFAPAPTAAPSISFDGRGFLIQGKRTFLASGGLEYARIPHELWRDRLLRIKRAGLNTIEIYTPWNFHEPQKGHFEFSGDKDLDAFLKLVHEMGLYAIVRVGPYICAEWDSGGYPVWLRFEPGLRVREDNAPFEAAVDRFWDKLLPIVAANQINHGGAVILVQLENEHPSGGGKDIPNGYFQHLKDKAVALGIQVPYFFSGLHHNWDPAGNAPWSSAGRTSPWFTTEFWTVWYDKYGETPDSLVTDRRTWKILAYGGNGYNYYMMHGGSNFDSWNDDEDAASYDYGAAIGQTGDLRPLYPRFKRAALFARSFEAILENSDNATEAYKALATNPAIQITARKSPAGAIMFLDNPGDSDAQTQIRLSDGTLYPDAGPMTLAAGQIMPIVSDAVIRPGVTLVRAANLLGIQSLGSTTTLVAYAPVGSPIEMSFDLAASATPIMGSEFLHATSHGVTLKTTVAASDPRVVSFKTGAQTIRLLIVSTALADRTWFINNRVVVGPEYAGEMTTTPDGHLTLVTETAAERSDTALVYGEEETPRRLASKSASSAMPPPPSLTSWQARSGQAAASPTLSDSDWKASRAPLPMGADGDYGAYAWYRATITTPKADHYTLHCQGGDWISVFLNGKPLAAGLLRDKPVLALPSGRSSLAVLVGHRGRPKLYNHLGEIDQVDAKGLSGPVTLSTTQTTEMAIKKWLILADDTPDKAHPPTETRNVLWQDANTGDNTFKDHVGYYWFHTTVQSGHAPIQRLHFENVDNNATVYLNGVQVGAHEGWGVPFDIPLTAQWRDGAPNDIMVLVENTDGPGGIQGAVSLQSITPGIEQAVVGWKMHGGLDVSPQKTPWQALKPMTGPAFYRSEFVTTPPQGTGPHPILRIALHSMSAGCVWLNGHNLGRYPEKVAVDGLYLPECWQKPGKNEIVIFDEEGKPPTQVAIVMEQAASRQVISMTETK